MSKKDYQAVARAFYANRPPDNAGALECVSRKVLLSALADTFAANNPRFDRARFIEACETGTCKGMRKVGA